MVLPKGGVHSGAWVEGWVVWGEVREPTCHELFTAEKFDNNLVMILGM